MIRDNLILDLNDELIVDNFAGGGGASTGKELALGRHVDHAINHDFRALGMHRINHPQTVHHCEDVFDIEPLRLTEGRRVGLAWFSPDCKHFSKAKGGRPLDKKIRGLAFVMFRWAKIRVRVMMMENVEEIQTWGPLLHHAHHRKNCNCGKPCGRPDPAHKGRTWQAFLSVLGAGIPSDHPDIPEMIEVLGDSVTREELERGFGYDVEAMELRACDYGTPTIRKRLFLICRCDGMPIVWPKPTHATPDSAKSLGLKPYRPVAECIDWHLACHSIFLTKEQARQFRCKRPLVKSTLRRIATGIDRYVLKAKRPFMVNLTHQGSDRLQSVDEPVRTVTGANRGEKAVVAPVMVQKSHYKSNSKMVKGADEPMRTQAAVAEHGLIQANLAPFITEHANASAQRNVSVEKPMPTQCAEIKGGHFAVVAPVLARQFGESVGQPVDAPAPTVMPGGQGKTQLISASLVVNTTGHPGAPVTEPAPTIPTGGHHAVIAAHLTKFNTGSVGSEMDKPAPTITAGDHSPDTHGGAASTLGVVGAILVGAGGPAYAGEPRPVTKPVNTILVDNNTHLAAASMVKLRGDAKTHSKGSSPDEPIPTISAGGQHQSVSMAYLAQHNGGFNKQPGHDAREPLSTISGKGSQQQVVSAALAAYYGCDEDGQAVDEPSRTVTTNDRFGLHTHEAVIPPMTPEQIAGARRVAAFLREYGVEFEGEFATVGGYVIVDIGMRMLTPRELFRAQGFPEDYVIDRAWVIDPKTGEIVEVHLTKEQQIRMCGNSVCPPVATAIVAANVPELAVWSRGERAAVQRRLEAVV